MRGHECAAVDPDVYITSVVTPGSVRKWRSSRDDFVRISEQRLCCSRAARAGVEQVHITGASLGLLPGHRELTSRGEWSGPRRSRCSTSSTPRQHRAASGQPLADRAPDRHPGPAAGGHFARFGTRRAADFIEQYIRATRLPLTEKVGPVPSLQDVHRAAITSATVTSRPATDEHGQLRPAHQSVG